MGNILFIFLYFSKKISMLKNAKILMLKSHCKTGYFVILNEVNDLNSLEI